jgi:hypothetical protein
MEEAEADRTATHLFPLVGAAGSTPTSRSIRKRLLVSAGCVMPSASDALWKLAW